MGQTTKPPFMQKTDRDAIEDEVDAVIELCGHDPRAAIRGLILGQALMKTQIGRGMPAGRSLRRLH